MFKIVCKSKGSSKMGLWWKKTYEIPTGDIEKNVSFGGDPEALSKRWPILWRFCQNWQILRVASSEGFRLHFRTADGQCMSYRNLIFSEYVAVRVGTEIVLFWATSGKTGHALKIADMRIMIPGRFRSDRRDMWQRQDADRFEKSAQFI